MRKCVDRDDSSNERIDIDVDSRPEDAGAGWLTRAWRKLCGWTSSVKRVLSGRLPSRTVTPVVRRRGAGADALATE
jgi:hypothetical protein